MAKGAFSSVSKRKKNILSAYPCMYCDAKDNLCVDHILPPKRGGNSDLDNLTSSCISCNSMKTDMTISEWETRLVELVDKKTSELNRLKRILKSLQTGSYKIQLNG